MKEKSDIQLAIEGLARRLGITPEQLMRDLEERDPEPDPQRAKEFGAMAARLWTKRG